MFQVFYKTERDVILSTGGELAFDKRGDKEMCLKNIPVFMPSIKTGKEMKKNHKWGENTGKVIDSVARNKQSPLGASLF